mmetsp:Transcript_122204/g.390890  ORF Transcript_122204/g.390890 Transcript_122204/m.390890 type:complete len:637 (+) Transcript_122204:54-1964(+)
MTAQKLAFAPSSFFPRGGAKRRKGRRLERLVRTTVGTLLLVGSLLAAAAVFSSSAASRAWVDVEAGQQRRQAAVSSRCLPKRIDRGPCQRGEKWHGVNYGNRFVPEDWMKHPYDFFKTVRQCTNVTRKSLWDLDDSLDPTPRERMLGWLNETISEAHFEEMHRFGVQVVRVPCGYWHWISYGDDEGPEAPEIMSGVAVAERLRNLHRIARPEDYRPFFDRIFEYAAKYGIKVLLDLHGLPGSQNGEIHSGTCLQFRGKPNRTVFFETNANRAMAVRAVSAMAKYSKDKASLFGIQVINEPHLQSKDKGHRFLKAYYRRAIHAARKHLDASVPIVLFVWTYTMEKWEANAFPEEEFGAVLWDTHLYQFPKHHERWTTAGGGLLKAIKAYKWDLEQLRYFSNLQGGRVIVGEYSMAGQSLQTAERQEFLQWLVDQFDFVAAGSLVWTFDGDCPGWSMQQQAQKWRIDWRRVTADTRHDTDEGAAVRLRTALRGTAGQWLSAHKCGAVWLQHEADWWEQWVPYRYRVDGDLRIALRSAAHGTWLSVTDSGHVGQAEWRSLWEEFRVVTMSEENGVQQVALVSVHGTVLTFLQEQNAGLVVAIPPTTATPSDGQHACPSSPCDAVDALVAERKQFVWEVT